MVLPLVLGVNALAVMPAKAATVAIDVEGDIDTFTSTFTPSGPGEPTTTDSVRVAVYSATITMPISVSRLVLGEGGGSFYLPADFAVSYGSVAGVTPALSDFAAATAIGVTPSVENGGTELHLEFDSAVTLNPGGAFFTELPAPWVFNSAPGQSRIEFSSIPEPNAAMLAALGFLLIFRRRR